eukprot:15473146-Alexandrium_andersonii.AAC.1
MRVVSVATVVDVGPMGVPFRNCLRDEHCHTPGTLVHDRAVFEERHYAMRSPFLVLHVVGESFLGCRPFKALRASFVQQ